MEIITIAPEFLTATIGYIGDLFAGVGILVALAIGLPLAFWTLRKVIGLVKTTVGR